MDALAGARGAAMTQQPTDQPDVLAQILDYANRANPYPLYAQLRETPVLLAPNGSYVISNHGRVIRTITAPGMTDSTPSTSGSARMRDANSGSCHTASVAARITSTAALTSAS